eukprot:7377947-Prymnesium_polylepis.1
MCTPFGCGVFVIWGGAGRGREVARGDLGTVRVRCVVAQSRATPRAHVPRGRAGVGAPSNRESRSRPITNLKCHHKWGGRVIRWKYP